MDRIARPLNFIILLLLVFVTFRLDSKGLMAAESSIYINVFSRDMQREEIYLHVDRDKYIAGEDIWFSIFSINMETQSLSTMSVIAYVELLNPWNLPVMQTRFQLSDGRGGGNFSLPDSISSGTYTIRAYTNWMKNFLPVNCYMHNIDILNPFKNSDFRSKGDLKDDKYLKKIAFHNEKGKMVALTADSIFGRREKVSLMLGTTINNEGLSQIYTMSISVTPDVVSSGSEGIEEYILRRNRSSEYMLSGITTLPKYKFETDGHFLSVVLKYRQDNVSDSSEYLFMSIQGKVAEFRYADRDTSGYFTFVLPVDNVSRNLILQPEYASNNITLEIEPPFSRILPESYSFSDTLTESQLDVFSQLSFNYQAAMIYGVKLKNEAEPDDRSAEKKRRFYGIPEMEVFLGDYISLPSMQEVFFELLPGIFIRPGKSGYVMQIINPLTGVYYHEPPLVMIDGVIINDIKILLDLNPETVEKIEAVKTPYLIGNLVLHGIVNVITHRGDFSDVSIPEYAAILPYRVIDKPATFLEPDYSDEQTRLNRTPDLRNTLYWNPSVNTDSTGKAEIQFWTSDFPGKYIINIQGISGTGEKLSIYRSFVVR